MAYDIHIHEENIVYIRFQEQADVEENERARKEVMQICRDTGITSVLADWQEAETAPSVSTMNLYDFGHSWDRTHGFRIATVLPTDERSRDDIKFSGTVAHNRGLLLTKAFDDVDDALSWLNAARQR